MMEKCQADCVNCQLMKKEKVNRDSLYHERQKSIFGHRGYTEENYNGPYNLATCPVGVIFQLPLSSHDFNSNYRNETFPAAYVKKWEETWKPIFNGFLDRLETRGGKKPPGKLLDLGSQFGLFPETAKTRGWNAYGIDISNFTALEAAKYRRPLIQASASEISFSDKIFDVVTCWMAFEDLVFWQTLAEIRRVLKPNGLLALKVANADFYLHMRKIPLPLVQDVLTNLHLSGWPYRCGFNPSTLEKILENAGYERIRIYNYMLSLNNQNLPHLIERVAINTFAQTVRFLSGGKIIIGPWLEIYAESK